MAVRYLIPSDSPPNEMRLDNLSGGLNLKFFESFIGDNQSPDLLNMDSDDRGSLTKRKGWIHAYTTALGDKINGLYYYSSKFIFSCTTKLYSQTGTAAPVELYSGLANAKTRFFEFNSILYIMNGTDFIQYNGTTASAITPYIPLTYINRLYTGGGDANENINRLGAGFSNAFNGDGTHTLFLMSSIGLDATTVTCTIAGVTVVENTGFTVDRPNGTINFAAGTSPHGAPASGTSNVVITAYKTVTANINTIKNCKYSIVYGGENDTRVFLCGNGNYVFYSGLLDPTYWPYNNYNRIGDPGIVCTGFSKLYDILVIFKPNSIYSMTYLNESTIVSFPTKPLNSWVGCDMPDSIQIVNDCPIFGNSKKGIYVLYSQGSIKEEKNVRIISDNINGTESRSGLLDFSNAELIDCSSIDFNKKYWLCVTDKVYLWDYNLSPYQGADNGGSDLNWFLYDNVNANCFAVNSTLDSISFGDRTIGRIKTFSDTYNDNDLAIKAYWKSKLFAFKSGKSELTDWYKSVLEIWLTTRAVDKTSLTISYYTERNSIENAVSVPSRDSVSFDWDNFDWDYLNWEVASYGITINKKPKLKNIKYFQIKFENNVVSENLSLISLVIQYIITNRIK